MDKKTQKALQMYQIIEYKNKLLDSAYFSIDMDGVTKKQLEQFNDHIRDNVLDAELLANIIYKYNIPYSEDIEETFNKVCGVYILMEIVDSNDPRNIKIKNINFTVYNKKGDMCSLQSEFVIQQFENIKKEHLNYERMKKIKRIL